MNLELVAWPLVVAPAAIIALAVRLDAKLLGPYFALSELIPGFGNDLMVGDRVTRAAMIRRLFYPLIVGAAASFFGVFGLSLASVGFIGAGLLLWPIIFQGLPYGVSRYSKTLPILYVSFLISYAGLSLAGGYIVDVMRQAEGGDLAKYVAENFRDWAITGLVVAVFTSWGHGAQNALRRRSRQ
jgi:hypothetical protein